MKVLVACEESQAVTIELRKLGHEAYSCDLLPCSGDHPEWHIQDDAITQAYRPNEWDMMIAFPPCTYLTVSGNRWFDIERYGDKARKRHRDRKDAIYFFNSLFTAPIPKIAVENPIGIMSTEFRKPDQIVQPWMFGEQAQKSTCLWLKNMPLLQPTDVVSKGDFFEWTDKNGKKKSQPMWYYKAFLKAKTNEERSLIRSKTFPGIAKAMAEQWGNN